MNIVDEIENVRMCTCEFVFCLLAESVVPDDPVSHEKAEFVGNGYMASITYTYDDSGNILNVWIESPGAELLDTDKDGMDDDWERFYFGDLTIANATTDSDGDGYSDLAEYLNWRDGILDPEGYGFDPLEVNAPGGSGYQIDKFNILLFLPAIMNSRAVP